MNDSSVIRDGREELGIIGYKYLCYLRSTIVLLESGLRLIVNIYCNHENIFQRSINNMLNTRKIGIK